MILKIGPFRDCVDMGSETDIFIIENIQERHYQCTDGNAKSLGIIFEISIYKYLS